MSLDTWGLASIPRNRRQPPFSIARVGSASSGSMSLHAGKKQERNDLPGRTLDPARISPGRGTVHSQGRQPPVAMNHHTSEVDQTIPVRCLRNP